MSDIVLSAFLSVIFEKLAFASLEKLAPYAEINSEVKKLECSLFQIRDLLTDASQKEINNQYVKRWLNGLQHLAYDIDDLLDDLATEALHRELTDEPETHISKVRKFFSTCFTRFSLRTCMMKNKLNDVTTKLQDLIEEKAILGLVVKEETRSTYINRRLQTSMVHVSSIVGRQAEKQALVHKLLGSGSCDQNFSIVPIVGMGGVGKTTLARLLYDEKQVNDHFELKAWVCVSDEFDSFGISKVIFESVAGVDKDFADLNLLQVALRDHLREKRFLLVLDDVWSESCEDWDTLVGPFHACATGSKIIIITRKNQLLNKLGYNHINQQLQKLSHVDALSLVALHALGVHNFDSHMSLKTHGEGIVKKCDGLPLALIALGRLLRTKKDDEGYWKRVLNSKIWSLQGGGGIVPALSLSYHELSAHLKQVFAYCSLFPKGFRFDKNELVLLWMAEGFLQRSTSSDSTKERLGREYFDELLSRSFFQHAPNDKSLFVMHDLMNDLATSVAGKFFFRLDNETEKDIRKEVLERYRHMSFVRDKYTTYKKFETFKRAKSLRTFLATSAGVVKSQQHFYFSNTILVDLLSELPLLRVLCLNDYEISEVPESIGNLRHLRYLNLSRTRITNLPENVSSLYHLQTLVVSGCHSLVMLPNFLNLKNLRHLDISDTPCLNKMPIGIGGLKRLRTLSKIIIKGESGFEITRLKDLKNLRGKISIVGLEKLQNAIHAREANFSQKKLSELKVEWNDGVFHNKMLEKEVLNKLKPHNDYLKQLVIVSYGGLEFPNWVGDPLFLRLNKVSIHGCKSRSLPPLGQLPSLKELYIDGLNRLKVMGLELLGINSVFPSLRILSFVNMPRWEKWSMDCGVVFPCLRKLIIRNCCNLVEVSLEALPSLTVLELNECDTCVLRKLVEIASIVKLKIKCISGLNDMVWRGVIEYLRAVEELSIQNSNIRYLWESESVASKVLVKLRNLKIYGCENLVSLGEIEEYTCRRNYLLRSLRKLEVGNCYLMERICCPNSIETLRVFLCHSVAAIFLPTGGEQKLKSLDISYCPKLLEREWGGKKITNERSNISYCHKLLEREWGGKKIINERSNMPVLEHVKIIYWQNLDSITALSYLVQLTKLSIVSCKSLKSFPEYELSSLTSLKVLQVSHCPNINASFPCGIWPPNLRSLEIGKLNKPISEWEPQNFPTSLVQLHLYGDDGVSSCSQFSHLLPISLTSLKIDESEKLESVSMGLQHLTSLKYLSFSHCHNLRKLSHLQHLTSLRHLSFCGCPNMMDLPEMLFTSLLSLTIFHCPSLEERCTYWPLVSSVPCINIYSSQS